MILKLAARNLSANKKRSIVTVILAFFTTATLIFMSGLTDGGHNSMLKLAVETYPGYVQITGKEYREEPNYDNIIFNLEKVEQILKEEAGVSLYSTRLESFVLFANEKRSVGGMLAGIVPEREGELSVLKDSLVDGRYLNKNDTNGVYVGKELAKKMKLKVGDTFSFIGSDIDFSFAADNLHVVGLFQTGLFDFDLSSVFINKSYFDGVMNSANAASHVIILPKNHEESQSLAISIGKKLPKDLRAADWKEYMANLVESMEIDSIFGYITLGFLFIVIFFVVMIYSLLSVFARTKEISVLRALGTSDRFIFQTLLSEAVILSLVGGLLGFAAGYFSNYYFFYNPIEVTGYEEQYKQYGLAVQSSFPTDLNLASCIRDAVIVFVLNILSSLYPIFKVNSLKPVEGIYGV